MKRIFRSFSPVIILLLCACVPKQPAMPLTEVPAGPVLHALEERRQSFKGLKALASVEVRKWGKKRVFENVGIVLDGQRRLRMEAYGPLGQSVMVLVWDGRDVFLRMPENDKILKNEEAALDEILGEGLTVQELSAVLSGNIPTQIQPHTASLYCSQDKSCVLEIRNDTTLRRLRIAPAGGIQEQGFQIASEELQQSGKLVYQVRFGRAVAGSHYLLPMQIEIENPDRNLQLVIEYSDVEINVPIREEAFTLSDGSN